MKRNLPILCLVAAVLLTGCGITGKTASEKRAEEEKTARSVPYGGGKGLTFKEDIQSYTDKGWEKGCRHSRLQPKP